MSQSRIRGLKVPPASTSWWPIALGFASVAILFVALWFFVNWAGSFRPAYETTPGRVLEIRKVVDGTANSQYGSRILYGVEAHVHYEFQGQVQDRWLRASDDLPRETLLLKLSTHPIECLVYWPQNHPENVRCSFK
jgi:hypothetical protein